MMLNYAVLQQCGFHLNLQKICLEQVIFGDGHVGTPRQNRFDPGQGLELMTPEVLHARRSM